MVLDHPIYSPYHPKTIIRTPSQFGPPFGATTKDAIPLSHGLVDGLSRNFLCHGIQYADPQNGIDAKTTNVIA